MRGNSLFLTKFAKIRLYNIFGDMDETNYY